MPSKLQRDIERIRKEIAEDEAQLGAKREKLARLERRQNPEDHKAVSGLDLLWKAALPKSRERSSRHKCRVAWHRIPAAQRPPVDQAVAALKAWNRSEEWSKEGNRFAPGLHRFISERMWEDLPEVRDPMAVYRSRPKPAEEPRGEVVDDPEEQRRLLGLPPKKP